MDGMTVVYNGKNVGEWLDKRRKDSYESLKKHFVKAYGEEKGVKMLNDLLGIPNSEDYTSRSIEG